MATIYRFLIEDGIKGDGKTTAKRLKGLGKGKGSSHTNKMKAINPILNKSTHGMWEKGNRFSKAARGLIKVDNLSGSIGLSSVAITTIIMMVVQVIMQYISFLQDKADRENESNFKKLEVGKTQLSNDFKISVNALTGRVSFNDNE